MLRVAWSVFVIGVVAGCDTSTCTTGEADFASQLAGSALFEVRLVSSADDFDLGLHGTAVNRSAAEDCRVALYAFPARPDEAELTPLLPGAAPAVLAGGRLVGEYALPRAGAHTFEVTVDYTSLGDGAFAGSFDAWLAAVPCADAEVDLRLEFYMTACRAGFRAPSYTSPFVEQLW